MCGPDRQSLRWRGLDGGGAHGARGIRRCEKKKRQGTVIAVGPAQRRYYEAFRFQGRG